MNIIKKLKIKDLREVAVQLGMDDVEYFTKPDLLEEIAEYFEEEEVAKAVLECDLGGTEPAPAEKKGKSRSKKPKLEVSGLDDDDDDEPVTGEMFSALEQVQRKMVRKEVKRALSKIDFETPEPREVIINAPAGKVDMGDDILPEEFERILQLANQRINTMIVGPSGCGKTHIAEKVAKALKLEFSALSCSAGMSESQLAGWLLPMGKGGQFVYVAAEFVNKYENGGVFLLDEVDAGDQNTMVFLNSAISNGYLQIPQRSDKPIAHRHKDFVLIAAANTYGNGADMQYVGRNQLDAATLDRFRVGMVFMDYSDRVEETLIDQDVLKWGRKIRKVVKDHGLRRIMSTRTMLDLTTMKASEKWDAEDWGKGYFADWSEDEKHIYKNA